MGLDTCSVTGIDAEIETSPIFEYDSNQKDEFMFKDFQKYKQNHKVYTEAFRG